METPWRHRALMLLALGLLVATAWLERWGVAPEAASERPASFLDQLEQGYRPDWTPAFWLGRRQRPEWALATALCATEPRDEPRSRNCASLRIARDSRELPDGQPTTEDEEDD